MQGRAEAMTASQAAAAVAIALRLAAPPGPADTLEALGRALTACFEAPAGASGSAITVLVSLRRDGTVLGQPRITFSHLVGAEAGRRAFVEAALGSLKACTPVSVTPGLGGAIAGRPFSIRFVGGAPPLPI